MYPIISPCSKIETVKLVPIYCNVDEFFYCFTVGNLVKTLDAKSGNIVNVVLFVENTLSESIGDVSCFFLSL